MRLPTYDRLGFPVVNGDQDAAEMFRWQETRRRVLAGDPAPDDEDSPSETHPCGMSGCPHLASYYTKHCPIHATQGEYEPAVCGVDWGERVW